jgi:hypothetical protein
MSLQRPSDAIASLRKPATIHRDAKARRYFLRAHRRREK